MAISKRVVIEDIKVLTDGQVIVFEVTEYWNGGFIKGTMETVGPRTGRMLDVGDDVTMEDQIVRDIVKGTLHSAARKTARDIVKETELT